MNGWESLYFTATGDYNNGNYKDSYANYLKAANALLYKLTHEVTFVNKETIKTKPHNAAHLFAQLKSCVQKLEDILQNRATNGTISSPPYSISDLAASIITANPTPQHLPLIPFSPLTRQSMHHAHQLATANQKVSIIKQKSSDNSNIDDLRRLDVEIRLNRNKLDQVNNQIQSIGEVTLLHWDANEVSKQLTIIESELCKRVDFEKDLTLIKDKRTSKAQACMDFHRYLTNSFTHQFMIYADITRSSANSSRSSQHPRENIIAHAVKIAQTLLNVHRNFNSFAALMKALTSPEVRRIRRLWANLHTRTHQQIKEFSSLIKKEDNEYKAYKDVLAQKIEMSRDIRGMVVIPWIQPHYEEVKSITQSYASGKSGDNSGVILSAPGQRKLASTFSLLKQCQSNNNDDEEWHSSNTDRKSSNSHKTPIGATTSLALDCMGNGNLELHHWLVSRIFLTKQQLIDESMEIEPLAENESPLCVENEYEEEEEESDNNSVGRLDIGSEDGGDNIEAGTSSNHEVTNGSRSQSNKPSPNKLEEHINSLLSSKSLLTSKHERSESGSKSIINGTSSTSVSYEISKPEEPKINVEVKDNDTNSLNNVVNNTIETGFTSSKTKAIPIPQPAGQKSHQPSLSPASMLPSLNPNAQVFIPRSNLSSSAPGPTSDTRSYNNNIMISIKDLTEMGKTMGNINTNATDDDDDRFVYPASPASPASPVSPVSPAKDDDEDAFVYQPASNDDSKDNADDDDTVFVYHSEDINISKEETSDAKDSQDDNDEGEGSSFVYTGNDTTSSDNNNNTNINKSEVTKVDKSSDSISVISVKLTAEGAITKVQG